MPATYEPIATTTLGSAASSITFSSIASSWTDLRLVVVAQAATGFSMYIRFNGDTATNYSGTRLVGDGSAASSARRTNEAQWRISNTNGLPTTQWGLAEIDLFSYAGSTFKTGLTSWSGDLNGSGDVEKSIQLYRSTSAITTIQISCAAGSANLNTGTTATLYGIKNA